MNLPLTSGMQIFPARVTRPQEQFRNWRRLSRREVSTKEVFHRRSAEDSKRTNPATYCAGDSAGVSAGDSVVAAGASVAAGLVSVAGAAVGAGVVAGATVSVFCSHAARSAAPARMQMYFFIIGDAYWFNRSIAASAVFGPAQNDAYNTNSSSRGLKRWFPF